MSAALIQAHHLHFGYREVGRVRRVLNGLELRVAVPYWEGAVELGGTDSGRRGRLAKGRRPALLGG
jgi:hypothetical protein